MKHAIAGAAVAAALCGCNDAAAELGLDPAEHDGYFAAVSTNYTGATSISLLGADGEVVDAEWVSSNTKKSGLRTSLADDVVLPTVSASRRYLTTIERGIGVVTRFDLDLGAVLGQLRTDESPEDDEAAYHSNPQDVFYVGEESAWVSRWAPNLDPGAEAAERGSDLIEFDPRSMERTKRRIDLADFEAEVEETQYDDAFNPIGTVTSVAHACPAAIVPAGKFLVVGLVRATAAFNYAAGLTLIVDPGAAKVTDTVDLPGLSNCGDVRPVAGDDAQVLVGCIGSWGDGGATAGIVQLEVSETGTAKIVQRFAVADHDGAANSATNVVSLGADLLVAVAAGELDPTSGAVATPDIAYVVSLRTGKQTKLVTSAGAYSLGIPAFDPATGVLLVPDAGSAESPSVTVHRFVAGEDLTLEADGEVEVAAHSGLPVREIRRL